MKKIDFWVASFSAAIVGICAGVSKPTVPNIVKEAKSIADEAINTIDFNALSKRLDPPSVEKGSV